MKYFETSWRFKFYSFTKTIFVPLTNLHLATYLTTKIGRSELLKRNINDPMFFLSKYSSFLKLYTRLSSKGLCLAIGRPSPRGDDVVKRSIRTRSPFFSGVAGAEWRWKRAQQFIIFFLSRLFFFLSPLLAVPLSLGPSAPAAVTTTPHQIPARGSSVGRGWTYNIN